MSQLGKSRVTAKELLLPRQKIHRRRNSIGEFNTDNVKFCGGATTKQKFQTSHLLGRHFIQRGRTTVPLGKEINIFNTSSA